MTTKDLCIGNWVTNENGFPMFVQAIYDDDTVYLDFEGNEGDTWETDIKDVHPIELTEDIIEKIGFKVEEDETGFGIMMILNGFHIDLATLSDSPGRNYYSCIYNQCCHLVGGCDIQYVHELQNMVRLATGKDLEVKI